MLKFSYQYFPFVPFHFSFQVPLHGAYRWLLNQCQALKTTFSWKTPAVEASFVFSFHVLMYLSTSIKEHQPSLPATTRLMGSGSDSIVTSWTWLWLGLKHLKTNMEENPTELDNLKLHIQQPTSAFRQEHKLFVHVRRKCFKFTGCRILKIIGSFL